MNTVAIVQLDLHNVTFFILRVPTVGRSNDQTRCQNEQKITCQLHGISASFEFCSVALHSTFTTVPWSWGFLETAPARSPALDLVLSVGIGEPKVIAVEIQV